MNGKILKRAGGVGNEGTKMVSREEHDYGEEKIPLLPRRHLNKIWLPGSNCG